MAARSLCARATSASAAIAAFVKPGDTLFVHTASATPTPLLAALAAHGRTLPAGGAPIRVTHMHIEGPTPHIGVPGIQDVSYFCGSNVRKAVREGAAAYVPISFGRLPALLRRAPVAAALLTVSPPDSHGWCSLGTSVDATAVAAATARARIAICTPSMPRTYGDAHIHVRDLDALVDASDWNIYTHGGGGGAGPDVPAAHSHAAAKPEAATEKEAINENIAERIAALIKNGDTLQLGIGAIPDHVLHLLRGHKNLRVHSELISDGVQGLVESGAVTDTVVAAFAMGTRGFYRWMHDNVGIRMSDVAHVNDLAVIRGIDSMVGVNGAIEIALDGSAVSDSIGTAPFSGVGGQSDFIQGCQQSDGGRAILALHSRTSAGKSRIVPFLRRGGGVVTPRAFTQWVVTEHGAVNVYGMDVRARANALLGLAHPDDRAQLRKEAAEGGLLI